MSTIISRATGRRAALLVVAALLAGSAGATARRTVPWRATHYHPTYAVQLDTPELAAGWADDVFIAEVTEREGVRRTNGDRLLWTTYRVEVRETLKGQATGSVRVAQEGGDDPLRRRRVVVGDAPALQPGMTYVLATRLASDGWHTAPSNFTPVQVAGGEQSQAGTDPATAWQQGAAHPQSQRDAFPSAVSRSRDPAALYDKARVR